MMKELTTEIYKDAASPAVSEVGKVAGRSVKALLSPIRGFLWCWEKIEEYVEQAVQKKLEGVPEERLTSLCSPIQWIKARRMLYILPMWRLLEK